MAHLHNRRGLLVSFMAACAVVTAGLLPAPGWAARHTEAMVVDFSIKDYATWRPVFDGARADRAKAGVTNARVFRDADKPDHMLVLFDVTSRDKARAWMQSAAVKADWAKGGVLGVPTYHFLR